jgi:serine protease Do
MMSIIDTLEQAAATVNERSSAAVVRIGRGPGRGSGVVVAPGVVATNAHNLRGSTTTITFADGRQVTGTVAGVDGDGDLAAVGVDTAGAPPIARIEGGADPRLGQVVFGVGARPGGGARVTFGLVSGTAQTFRGPGGRLIADGVEHTAALAPGSSGGPVVDAEGRLLALSTHRLGDGFYLAVPATADLEARLTALAAGTTPTRRRLGVAITPAHAARRLRSAVGLPERDGVLLAGVEEERPAGRAGLRRGDLIVSVDGRAVASADDLLAALSVAGDTVALTVVRQLDELDVRVALSTPAEASPAG